MLQIVFNSLCPLIIFSVININLCIDLTITTEKLMELFAPLDPEKVDELGGYLELPQSEIVKIQDCRSPAQRKEAYLDVYVCRHPYPAWRQVAEVLNVINLPQQADFVENTYDKGRQDTL